VNTLVEVDGGHVKKFRSITDAEEMAVTSDAITYKEDYCFSRDSSWLIVILETRMNCVLEVDHVCSQRFFGKNRSCNGFLLHMQRSLKTDDVDENYHIFRDDDQQLSVLAEWPGSLVFSLRKYRLRGKLDRR
jgi:hypothetical protein